MSTYTEKLATDAVEAFLAELRPAVRSQLSDAQLERLRLLVQDAVSAAIHHAAERMEKLVGELRIDAGSLEIEL